MCFNARYRYEIAMRRAAHFGNVEDYEYWRKKLEQYITIIGWEDLFQASAYLHPKVIVYENTNIYEPLFSQWGFIPDWAKEPEKIWNKTLNARGETIFEKSSYRKSAETKRCLIPVEGFYEHHEFRGNKYPFYISNKDKEPMYLAGLWNDWVNKQTGENLNTYTIVTTKANPLMTKIHNKPKFSNDHRMPVILPEDIREEWLKPLSRQEIHELATYVYPDSKLDAWTVRKLSGKDSPGNVPEANEKFEYPDLIFDKNSEPTLF